jgi:hypothetical protein
MICLVSVKGVMVVPITKLIDEFGHDLSLSGSTEAVQHDDPLFLQRNGRYRWVEAFSKSLEDVIPPCEHRRESRNSFQGRHSGTGVNSMTCGGS